MKVIKKSQKALSKALSAIRKGKIVVSPTDTVYGFLADASNKKAVEDIFRIKKRAKNKPLAIFVKDIKTAKELAQIDKKQEKILSKYWPGKYTFLLKSKIRRFHQVSLKKSEQIKNQRFRKNLSNLVISKNGTIALRIPKHKFLQELLKKINRPLVQTSVNISGEPAMTKISNIIKKFGRKNLSIFIIDGGNLKKGRPSKIIDLRNNKKIIIRK